MRAVVIVAECHRAGLHGEIQPQRDNDGEHAARCRGSCLSRCGSRSHRFFALGDTCINDRLTH